MRTTFDIAGDMQFATQKQPRRALVHDWVTLMVRQCGRRQVFDQHVAASAVRGGGGVGVGAEHLLVP